MVPESDLLFTFHYPHFQHDDYHSENKDYEKVRCKSVYGISAIVFRFFQAYYEHLIRFNSNFLVILLKII